MNLVVAVKQVPDTEAAIRIAPDRKDIDRSALPMILNPYDEFAVEEALRLREAHGGSVWVVTVGPPAAVDVLRTAIAMGADDALHIVTEHSLDALTTAALLAQQIKTHGFDLVLTGREAIDDGYGLIAPMLAEMLEVPVVTLVSSLKLEDGSLIAERDVEGGRETLRCALPAVVSAQKGLNEPRYPSLKGKMMAKKKEIPTVSADVSEAKLEVLHLGYPPIRSGTKILGEGIQAVPELVRILRDELKVI
ncbi:MAG: electron transfer flavoprotein subunit beta/FixA family protein [candidate division KSB1 bacterium]|nr:electron transfer flavoprotein subunit beta/FixA family protein [candidate division KSB1 bacterium]